MLPRFAMMTTKKRGRFLILPGKEWTRPLGVISAVAAVCLLTACGPPGARQLRRGEQLIEDGQYSEAVDTLSEAARILRDASAPPVEQAKAFNLLGLACQHAGKLDMASQAYLKALKLDRNNAAVDFNLGCVRMDQSNYPGAMDYLTAYVTLQPRDVQGYLRLGAARLRYAMAATGQEKTRRLEAARDDFRNADKLKPTAEAANALGMIDMQHRAPTAETLKAAEADFELALRRDPRYAPALLNEGIICQEYLNKPQQALKCYRAYLDLAPAPPHAKEVEKLAHDLDMSLRIILTPEQPPPSSGRIIIKPTNATATRPKPAPAESPPVQATAPAPAPTPAPEPAPAPALGPASNPAPVAAIVPAPEPAPPPESAVTQPSPPATESPSPSNAPPAVKTPEPSPAPAAEQPTSTAKKSFTRKLNPLRWFEGKPKTSPDSSGPPVPPGTRYEYPPPVLLLPGNRQEAARLANEAARARQAGDYDQAARAYTAASAADPASYDARLGLGLTEIDRHNYPAALLALNRALALQEDSADARYALAWTLQKRGYIEDAVHELERLLTQHPNEARAHLLLGNLYAEKLGQPKLAREQYRLALELDPTSPQAPVLRAWLQQHP
jgi:tetratricopeptide (TPR) repeat protein